MSSKQKISALKTKILTRHFAGIGYGVRDFSKCHIILSMVWVIASTFHVMCVIFNNVIRRGWSHSKGGRKVVDSFGEPTGRFLNMGEEYSNIAILRRGKY